MSTESIKNAIRDVPDFPQKGIIFKDITPVLQNAELLRETVHLLCRSYKAENIHAVAGVESRGFIFGGAMALYLGCAFIPIRKPGKLPYSTYQEKYELEYGSDALEIHRDAVGKGQNILLVDDLLATGGTAQAAAKLIEKCGGHVAGIQFFIELTILKGIERLKGYRVDSLIRF